MKSEKILVLGGSIGQLRLVNKSMELGYFTIVLDYNQDCVSKDKCDLFYSIDITDHQKCLEIAKKHNVKCVVTSQSDVGILTLGKINDDLGLLGISFETAMKCVNKILMRQELLRNNIIQPSFTVLDTESSINSEHSSFQLAKKILKAPDTSASRGIYKIQNINDLKSSIENAKQWTQSKFLILEEFIEGIEFGAQVIMQYGECVKTVFHEDIMYNNDVMVPVAHKVPVSEIQGLILNKEIEDNVINACRALGITDGIANVDLMFDIRSKKVHIIEIGARLGATSLSELMEISTNHSWEEIIINLAMGNRIEDVLSIEPAIAGVLTSSKSGVLIRKPFMCKNESFLGIKLEKKIGEKIEQFTKGTDRIGSFYFKGDISTLMNFYKREIKLIEQKIESCISS